MNRWLLAVFLIFFPSIALASVDNVNSRLILTTEKAYRLRPSTDNLQLANLPTSSKIVKQAVFGGVFVVIFEDGVIGYSEDGLRYYLTGARLVSGSGETRVTGRYFIIKDGDEALVSQDGKKYLRVFVGRDYKLSDFIGVADELFLLDSSTDKLRIYQLRDDQLSIGQTLECKQPVVSGGPEVIISCSGERAFRYLSGNWSEQGWGEFVVAESNSLTAVLVNSQQEIMIFDGQKELTVTLDRQYKRVDVLGSRVFLSSETAVYELDYKKLQISSPIDVAVDRFIEADATIVILGSRTLMSTKIFSFREIVLPSAGIDTISRAIGGYLLWTKGSSPLFITSDFTDYLLIDPPWAENAKIQSLIVFDNKVVIDLLNSQGKENFYLSEDLFNWKRITLPTKPTLTPTIAEARTFEPGALIEIIGYQTIKPGLVASNIIYLEDGTGGMQVYLSSTKGSLPTILGRVYAIDGEISSTKAKRLIVGSLEDIQYLGRSEAIHYLIADLSELKKYQGRLVKTQATVAEADTNSASLVGSGETLRLHFKQAADFLLKDDRISISGLADLGSSGVPEIWYDEGSFSYIARETVDESDITSSAYSSVPTDSKVETKTISHLTVQTVPVLVASQSASDSTNASSGSYEPLLYCLLGLTTGALIARGRRFPLV